MEYLIGCILSILPLFSPSSWNTQDAMDDTPGYYRGDSVYTTSFILNATHPQDSAYTLCFDGVNQEAWVYVNNDSVGYHAGGYTRFSLDITDKVKKGENTVDVRVSNAYNPDIPPLSADFTFFGGIYRRSYLRITSDVRIAQDGICVTTPVVTDKEAILTADVEVINPHHRSYKLKQTLVDADGRQWVLKKGKVKIHNPHLWSPDEPTLYTLVTQVVDKKGRVLDQKQTKVGFRYYRFDPDTIPVVHDSTEARLSAILLDGEPLEFFNKDSFSYVVPLPYTATYEPVLTAICLDTVARYVVNGNSIISTSADGQHQQTYTLAFEVLPKMDLFLAIGQSNMAGRAPYDDVAEPLEDVYLLTPNGSMEIASNPLNKYSNVRKDISVQGQGPHYQFARTMRDSLPDRTVGMVVNAQGGTSISIWYKPGTTNYDLTIARAKKAQKWGEYKGIIWHQGESDVTDGLSNNYATYKSRLQTMVSSLRTDLGCDSLWFIVGELSQKDTHQTFNEVVIQQIVSYISYADFVVSTGTSLLSDNTHFDEPSVQLMGQRYAEKILEHVYPTNKTTALGEQQCLPKAEKILSNGQMYIVINNQKFSLLGQTIY